MVSNKSSSCMMYNYNLCWIAGWQVEKVHWRSVEKGNVRNTFQRLSHTHSCHLSLIYTVKRLQSACKASNFTYKNALGINVF